MKLKDLFNVILGQVNIITLVEELDEAYSDYAKLYGITKTAKRSKIVWTGVLYNLIRPTEINKDVPEEYWEKEVTEIEPVYTIDDPGDYQPNIDLAINVYIE
jgi:hypothetical protein